ncbi:MAG: hypothetical protein JXR73_02995 [Candidatus Omnitrophica bacterium]|nr:hypothetical protein [Candidatus Omnitrophota bacterium]
MMKFRYGWIAFLICLTALSALGQSRIESVASLDVSAGVLWIDGDTLYVGGSDKLRIYDISNRASPSYQGGFNVTSNIVSITNVGNVVIAGLDSREDPNLLIVDASDRTNPTLLFERRTDQERKILQVLRAQGRNIFIGLDDVAIQIAELDENNDIKQIIGSLEVFSIITDIRIAGSRAFVSTWDSIMVVDISDPTDLRLVKEIITDDANNRLSIDGTILASAFGYTGVRFYDISNPDNPTEINTVYVDQNEVLSVSLRQKFCYAATYFTKMDYLDLNGGLRILDYENLNNIHNIYYNDDPRSAWDVIAYDGYVYVAEDVSLSVFRHGPLGERPTATPIIPTNTPTPTHTPTPTNTPPLLVTPTPTEGGVVPPTNTPVPPTSTPVPPTPTNTPTNTPIPAQPTNTPIPSAPTPTHTPAPVQPTNTPSTSTGELPAALFTADFDGPLLAHEQFVAQVPFNPGFILAQNEIGSIPSDNAFDGATNGRGLSVTVNPGEAVMFMGPYLSLEPGVPGLLRVNVRSTGGGVSVALAALDGSFDGSVSSNIPADSMVFNGAYKRMALVYKAPSNGVIPILQAAANVNLSGPVMIYFDNFELIPLPPGVCVPAEALGAGGIAP